MAGVLVAAFGSGWAIAIDSATYAVAAVCFGLIRVAALPAPETRTSMLSDLGAGAAEVFRHTWLWLLIGQALLYHLFFGGVLGVLQKLAGFLGLIRGKILKDRLGVFFINIGKDIRLFFAGKFGHDLSGLMGRHCFNQVGCLLIGKVLKDIGRVRRAQ